MSEVSLRLEAAPMSWRRWLAVGLAPLLIIMDGYDAVSISFAAPQIAKEWQVEPSTLGWLLSMELVGMAIGSVVLGVLADRIGRRPTVIACLITMIAGMYLAGQTGSVNAMLAVRLVTGLGIGGLLSTVSALVGEYVRQRDRAFAIAIMAMGYPVGGMVGGWIAADILTRFDWTAIFSLGALITALVVPLVLLFMPESPEWIERRRPARALERVNASLAALGAQPVEALASRHEQASTPGIAGIFRAPLLPLTVLLTLAYVFHVGAFYFLAKWLPKLAVEIGFTGSEGALVLSHFMMGASCGGLVFVALSKCFGPRKAILGMLALFACTMVLFGQFPEQFDRSIVIMVLFGIMANVPVSGIYVLLVEAYPPDLRATGVGFGIGVGRAGASLGPAVAGYLFALGASLQTVAMGMGASVLCAALAIWALRRPMQAATSAGR